MERNGVLLDVAAARGAVRASSARKMLEIEARAHAAGGPAVQPEFAASRSRRSCSTSRSCRSSRRRRRARRRPTRTCSQQLALDHPLPKLILEYRGLVEAQVDLHRQAAEHDQLPTTGRVHTNYAQAVAVTGRLSSNDPNLQNIPIRTAEGRRIREAFIAPPGSADRVRRLLADRAAHHGAHLAGREPAAERSRRARTSIARPRPKSSASRREASTASSAATPR